MKSFPNLCPKPPHIGADVRTAHSLSAGFYTEPAVFALEQERIFRRSWHVVGHLDQVRGPGDFFTTEVLGEPIVVVRGAELQLRSFYNVCRHRAGPPAEGCGSRKLFRCAYHGWTYDLAGKLISAPEFENLKEFEGKEFSLQPVSAEEWFNLIFVNLEPDAPPLHPSLGALPGQAERFPFREMKLFERRTYDMACNWKTYVDNYLEGYHLPSVHPGLNRELDYGSYAVDAYPGHVRQSSPIRGGEPKPGAPRRYPDAHDLTADYFWVFPDWMLNCYPDNISLNLIVPLAPERCLAIFEWYLGPGGLDPASARDAVNFSHQIQLEDVAICERVQKNLRSRSYESGRYSASQEKGVHAFHRMYARAMADPVSVGEPSPTR